MDDATASPPPPAGRLLTFRGGGWVLLLAGVLIVAIVAWQLALILRTGGSRAIGDGRTVASYRFDLSNCQVPLQDLAATGRPRDGLRALVAPPVMSAAEADRKNEEERGKYLVPGDRVIGIYLNGEARAYPLRVLNWHEIANDTLGGRAIAVTYNAVCDSAVVFERHAGGEDRVFGFSGLLYKSNLLLYDRREAIGQESLWSQLLARAIAGPAAGESLAVLPSALAQWGHWRELHPETTVLAPDPAMAKLYKRDPYSSYFGSEVLRYPVEPLPPSELRPYKTRVVVVGVNGRHAVFPLPAIAAKADPRGAWHTQWQGVPLHFDYRDHPPTVIVAAGDGAAPHEVIHAFWFAWYATHPDSAVVE